MDGSHTKFEGYRINRSGGMELYTRAILHFIWWRSLELRNSFFSER